MPSVSYFIIWLLLLVYFLLRHVYIFHWLTPVSVKDSVHLLPVTVTFKTDSKIIFFSL